MINIDREYLQILDSIDGFLLIDDQEKIVFMAGGLIRQTGRSCLEDVVGKSIREVIPTNNTYKILKTGKKQIGEVYFVEGYTIVSNGFPVFRDGELVGAFEYDVFENAEFLHGFLDKVNELSNELNYYKQELRSIRGAKYSTENIIGNSTSVRRLKEEIYEAAKTNSTVLILGETGVGKELVAHSIHKAGPRSLRNFIKINCASIPSELFESELFGYEEGSFTGARKGGKKGMAELANGGTLFLDEINQLPLHLQAKLLRFIQEREITHVGGDFSIPVDVRIIVAANEPLKQAVSEGRFREDLYYRLNVFEIAIAPLRDRKEDIPMLVRYIVMELNESLGRASHKVEDISESALTGLLAYDWPGNIRELHNAVERAMNRCYEKTLQAEHFHEFLTGIPQKAGGDTRPVNPREPGKSLASLRLESEIQAIRTALAESKGNKTEAARRLGISRQMLYNKIRQYGIGEE